MALGTVTQIDLDPTTGTITVIDSGDTFGYSDPNFVNTGLIIGSTCTFDIDYSQRIPVATNLQPYTIPTPLTMGKINIGGEIVGISTFIANGIIIRSNSTLSITENMTAVSKSDITDITIDVNDLLPSSSINGLDVKSDDGTSNLITIGGFKISNIIIARMTESTTGSGFSLFGELMTPAVIIRSTGAVAERRVNGGISQTTIKN